MGTGPHPGASDPVPPPDEETMPPPHDDTELPAESDLAVQQLLAGQPRLAMPAQVRARIVAALQAEAATRAALTANDADPAPTPPTLAKSQEPVREAQDLG